MKLSNHWHSGQGWLKEKKCSIGIEFYFDINNIAVNILLSKSTCIELEPTRVVHCTRISQAKYTGPIVIDHIKWGGCSGQRDRSGCCVHHWEGLVTIVTFLFQI